MLLSEKNDNGLRCISRLPRGVVVITGGGAAIVADSVLAWMIRCAEDSVVSVDAFNFSDDDVAVGRTGDNCDSVVAATGMDLGRDNRSAVAVVNRLLLVLVLLLLLLAHTSASSGGGLNRGGGNVSTVGDEMSVAGEDDEATPLDLAERTLLNLGEDMDKGDGVVADIVFATSPPPPWML